MTHESCCVGAQANDADFKSSLGQIVDLEVWAGAKAEAAAARKLAEGDAAGLRTELDIRRRDVDGFRLRVRRRYSLLYNSV